VRQPSADSLPAVTATLPEPDALAGRAVAVPTGAYPGGRRSERR
jgi:hypothetical protein